jgi:hypothetical protein
LAVERGLHQLTDLSEHVLLRRLGAEHAIEGKHMDGTLLAVGIRHGQLDAAARDRVVIQEGLHRRRSDIFDLGGRRAQAAKNPNIAFHFLDGVMELATVILMRV